MGACVELVTKSGGEVRAFMLSALNIFPCNALLISIRKTRCSLIETVALHSSRTNLNFLVPFDACIQLHIKLAPECRGLVASDFI